MTSITVYCKRFWDYHRKICSVQLSKTHKVKQYMRYSLFWDVPQRLYVVTYRRFGKAYWSQSHGSSLRFEDRKAVPKYQ